MEAWERRHLRAKLENQGKTKSRENFESQPCETQIFCLAALESLFSSFN